MKNILLLTIVIITLTSCSKMNFEDTKLSTAQLELAREITQSYQTTKLYNDSLVLSYNDSIHYPSSMRLYYDQMYHQQLMRFDNCHSRYDHTKTSANHFHDNFGKLQMHTISSGGMMGSNCGCCSNGGHDASVHTQMNELSNLHSNYHPK